MSTEEQDLSLLITTQDESQQVATPSKNIKNILRDIPNNLKKLIDSQISYNWLFLAIGGVGVFVVALFSLQYLTTPESTPNNNLICKSKIEGNWQTSLGKITLQAKSDQQIVGKYEYTNLERGKIKGEFNGKLRNNVISFDWQETPKQSSTQQGKGILVFGEGCTEFYGSYGTGDSTNNFGNWQGSRIPNQEINR